MSKAVDSIRLKAGEYRIACLFSLISMGSIQLMKIAEPHQRKAQKKEISELVIGNLLAS